MTTEVDVKIDPETGLPELPEGMFWRVGEKERPKDRYGYAYTSGYGQGVFLMTKQYSKKTVKTFVMGTKWWNRWMVMNEAEEFETVVTDTQLRFKTFTSFYAIDKDDVPSFADKVFETKSDKGFTGYGYSVPLTAEGIAHVAGKIWERYLQDLRESETKAKAKAVAEEAKDKFYGDYPPKTLIG